MQDRYAGDIGDYGKLGLLRALQGTGLSIGVNWYLTPNEGHNEDGKFTNYLDQGKYREFDPDLWDALKPIAHKEHRSVASLESAGILKATFFSKCLDFKDPEASDSRTPKTLKKADRRALRDAWFAESLDVLRGCDIIFLDPDNGLIVPSAIGRPKENKFVLGGSLADRHHSRDELAACYALGASIVYYQHKARKKDQHYTAQLDELIRSGKFPGATGRALKFNTTSQRFYLFLIQPKHAVAINAALDAMLAGPWGTTPASPQGASVSSRGKAPKPHFCDAANLSAR